MNTETKSHDIQNLDLAAIEKRARQLRADAIRDWAKSVKALFAALNYGINKQRFGV